MALAASGWRDRRALAVNPAFELRDNLRNALTPEGETLGRGKSIDLALQRRRSLWRPRAPSKPAAQSLSVCRWPCSERWRRFPQHEVLALPLAPAGDFDNRSQRSALRMETVEADESAGLINASKTRLMALGMFAGAVARIEKYRRRRIGAADGLIVAHIVSQPPGACLALRPIPQSASNLRQARFIRSIHLR
jgi:hypothetical protein